MQEVTRGLASNASRKVIWLENALMNKIKSKITMIKDRSLRGEREFASNVKKKDIWQGNVQGLKEKW